MTQERAQLPRDGLPLGVVPFGGGGHGGEVALAASHDRRHLDQRAGGARRAGVSRDGHVLMLAMLLVREKVKEGLGCRPSVESV